MRYSLTFTWPKRTEPIWFESIGELFLYLKEDMNTLCRVESEDGAEWYRGSENRVKGALAWKIIGHPPEKDDLISRGGWIMRRVADQPGQVVKNEGKDEHHH